MENDNNSLKNILGAISFIKLGVLLFITIIILNQKYSNTNFMALMLREDQSYIIIMLIMLVLVIIYLFWSFIYMKTSKKQKIKYLQIAEDIFYIIFLSLLIILSNNNSQYKYLYMFSIISGSILFGKNYGITVSTVSSLIITAIDLILSNAPINISFENDLVLSSGFFLVAYILSEYVKYEENQRAMLEMELQVIKLQEDVKTKVKLLDETKENNKAIIHLFGNISHELKTPLNVIFSSIQMLLLYNSDYEENMIEKKKNYLTVMKQNCFRLTRLINNILDTLKYDEGFITPHMENGDIISTVEDITMSIVPYAESKEVELIFDTEIEELITAFDKDKIERVILNLLSNALKFTDADGEIYVKISKVENEVYISVKDSGIGIPEDKLELIFERFGQVDKTLRRNHEGTGLGLAIVKSFIDLHHGKIKVNSKINKGSEFIITLPIYKVEGGIKSLEIKDDITDRITMELSDIYSDRQN